MAWYKYPIILVTTILVYLSSVRTESCQIEEGSVGVYYKNGALQEELVYPGARLQAVLIRPEETTLDTVYATTLDGLEISFEGVSVLSRIKTNKIVPLIKMYGTNFKKVLLYDRIKDDIIKICANRSLNQINSERFNEIVDTVKEEVNDEIRRLGDGGIEILNLAIRKPRIPRDLAEMNLQVKLQWNQQLLEVQKQKTEMIKKETELMMALSDANREKSIQEAMTEKEMIETEGRKKISELKSEILAAEEKVMADITKYAKEAEAEGNKALLTPEYLRLKLAESLANNSKVMFSGKDTDLIEKILSE